MKGQEGYLLWPLEALFQRPKKMAVAKLDVERVAARLVQSGLALGRDALTAYAELALAESAAKIAGEEARLGARWPRSPKPACVRETSTG